MILFQRDGYYHVEYFDEQSQKLRRKSLKTRNKNEALKRLTSFEKCLLQEQKLPVALLSQFIAEYTEHIRNNYSVKYLSSVELVFRKLTSYLTGDIKISEFNKIVAEKFLLHVFSYSKHSAHMYHRTLKAAFQKAITWNYINVNPAKGIKLPKVPAKHPAFITASELGKIREFIRDQDIRDIVTVGFYSGMRLSEILHLRWGAVNFKSATITVENTDTFTTKGKRERVIPIHKRILDILARRDIRNGNSYIFSKHGKLYRQDFISKKFKKAVRDAKLSEDIHFHSLRHSLASNLVQRGVSLYIVKDILGHESILTTQTYSHLQNEALTNAVNVLE